MKQLLTVLVLCLSFLVVHAEIATSDVPSGAEIMQSDNSVATTTTQIPNEKAQKQKKYYGSAIVGLAAYPEVSNVDKGYNVSAAAGYYISNRIMLDLGFALAKSQMSVSNLLFPNQRDDFGISQYQGVLGAKYQLDNIFGTSFKPVAGAVLSYTYRKYNLKNGMTINSGNTGNSTAIDAGVDVGVDYDLSQTYTLGLDFKYMFNLTNQVSSNYASPLYGYRGTPLESLQYYVAGLSARMNF